MKNLLFNQLIFITSVVLTILCINGREIGSTGTNTTKSNEEIASLSVEDKMVKIVEARLAVLKLEFKNAVDVLQEDIKVLKDKNQRQEKTISELKLALEKDFHSEKKLDARATALNHQAEDRVNSSIPTLPAPLLRTRRAVGNIAFSAYLTHTNSHMTGEAIKFNHVLLNDGNAYNSYTGAFTAPLSGVYMFSFYFDSHKLTFVRLAVNGVNQVDAVANRHNHGGTERNSQSMGGNTAIVHVNHGEAVLVEVYEIPDAEIASSDTFRLSSFSGVLLY